MSRETFTALQQQTRDLIRNDDTFSTTGMSDTPTHIKREINKSVRFIHDYLLSYKVQGDTVTIKTVAGQQFYSYPPGFNWIHTVTQEVGSIKYDLDVIESERTWNFLNMVDYSGTTIPQYIFPRKNDFGIYPTPSETDKDITFNAHYIPKDMVFEDASTGTVSIDNGTNEVLGTDTVFSANMVGKWFGAVDDGDWYQIVSVTDATTLVINRDFFGANVTDSNYVIGDSPNIPVVLHELIPFRSAANWIGGANQDTDKAQKWLNYFWTGDYNNPNRDARLVEGGLIGYVKRESARGREKSQLVRRGKGLKHSFDERWSTTLS